MGPPPQFAIGLLRAARYFCEGHIFLKEIWTHVSFGTGMHFACLKYFTYHLFVNNGTGFEAYFVA
jgi:hypothetical protein